LRRKLISLDRKAEAIIFFNKVLGHDLSNTRVVHQLKSGRTSYRKLWDIVRRARRRANRKYKIWKTYQIDIPRELLARWISDGLLTTENFSDILRVLSDYKSTVSTD